MKMRFQSIVRSVSLTCASAGLIAGLAAQALGDESAAHLLWTAGTLPVLVTLVFEIAISLRRGDVGLDLVAAISMTGALVLGEALAGNVVGLMYAGGQFLELAAEGRARRAMTALLARTPRYTWRYDDGGLDEIPIESVRPGDRLLIRQGDVLPVDGRVCGPEAMLDESALTGEPGPVRRPAGAPVMSGSANVGHAFDLEAVESAERSTYAGILRLVEEAQRTKAPMVRLADRYAVGFLFATAALAGLAWWASGDPVRALAVFVVATPCPLILAVPIALVAGMSRAAGRGVLVKGGGALERLSRVRTLVLDKTGTLTLGRPSLLAVLAEPGSDENEILRLAASLEQGSAHGVALALVEAGHERGLALATPASVKEAPGQGIEGTVEGRRVLVGGYDFAASRHAGARPLPSRPPSASGTLAVVILDGQFAAFLKVGDELRPEAGEAVARMRALGIERVVLATGDSPVAAARIAAGLGVDQVLAELSPAAKVDVVKAERAHAPVMMVGDGTNDAPALAAADLGVAMGVAGTAAAAETAEVVLLADNLRKIPEAMAIAQRSRLIALQSVVAGLGLSGLGMVAAAAGYLPPVQGALVQEAIDLAVIVNALRALRSGRR